MAKKPPKNVSADNFALGQRLLNRELRWYGENPEARVPSALLTAALASGKATGAAERAAEETRREVAAEAAQSVPFVSRLSPDWIDSMFNYDDETCSHFAGHHPEDYERIIETARTAAGKLDPQSPEYESLQQVIRAAEARQQSTNDPQ
jgi:hypothetical protein